MGLLIAAALGPAILPMTVAPISTTDACAVPTLAAPDEAGRPVASRDLVELADIGRSDPNDAPSPFGISPDGKRIAFVVRRGNPDANGFCQRLLVMPFDASGGPAEIDRGGEFIRDLYKLRNFTAIAAGYARVSTPRWSPDGKWIAYTKRTNGSTQVWLADPAGLAKAHRATAMPDDVDDFAWTRDGTALVVATRPAIRRQLEAIAREARDGYLFDDRFAPQFAAQPLPTAPIPLEYTRVELATGSMQPATDDQIAPLRPSRALAAPASARLSSSGRHGAVAWTEPKYPDELLSASKLVLVDPTGRRWTCDRKDCEGVNRLWWPGDGHVLFGLQRTGWADRQTALFRWTIGQPAPTRILLTDDALVGCAMQLAEIVCARESATRPRRLVALDARTGREREIFDPNPGFARLAVGKTQRFRFLNAYGVESFADLVLPPGHRQGERHPLVVVQYISDGFLRGGTDNEFPIQALAGRGFAVLSFSRPDFVPAAIHAKSDAAMRDANRKDWTDRRNVQSSLEIAVRMAVATGAVDPDRMGISGFSDGTSTVQWALINSRLFKVAAVGSCCEDLQAYPLMSGPAFERYGREMGYRFFQSDAADFWKPMSLVLNADRVDAPILIQTGDSEYQIGLDVVAAFRMRGKPIELFVLDHEGHFKVQPAHLLAMYERSLDWFDFWLNAKADCDPAKSAQYERWRAMKGAPATTTCLARSGVGP